MASSRYGHSGSRVAIFVVALTVSACAPAATSGSARDAHGLPIGPISYSQVDSHPEGHLFYPGSTIVQTFGGPEQSNGSDGGTSSAFRGAILASAADQEAIYSWYQAKLQSSGWSAYRISKASTWLSAHGYQRNVREIFIVAIDDPVTLQGSLGHPIKQSGTVFEIRYSIAPAGR